MYVGDDEGAQQTLKPLHLWCSQKSNGVWGMNTIIWVEQYDEIVVQQYDGHEGSNLMRIENDEMSMKIQKTTASKAEEATRIDICC